MQRLKIIVLCSKIATTSIQRNIQTSSHLLGRGKKYNTKFEGDVGLKHQKELYDDDPDAHEFTEEAEFESDNLNLMNAHKAYDCEISERKRAKDRLAKIITAQKYFLPPPQPRMLTHSEVECIKYLHKEDPEQWTPEALSESFPATPFTVKKILKKKVKLTPERIKQMDMKVQKNWELLAQDKLEAEPYVLKHLKKFLNRRHVLLEQINEHKLYLSEPKEEPVWNGGEMASILTSYEKQLKELEKENCESSDVKMIADGSDSVESKSDLDALHEEIRLEKSARKLEGKESFILGETIQAFSPHMTFEQLEDRILQKAEGHEDLSLNEKAILESKLGVKRNTKADDEVKVESLDVERNERRDASSVKKKSPKLSKNLRELESKVVAFGKSKRDTAKDEKYFREKPQATVPVPDERTVWLTEINCEKVNNLKKMSEPGKTPEKPIAEEQKPDEITPDPESEKRNRLFYQGIENEISNTPFWNNEETSKPKYMIEFQKRELKHPKDIDKITLADVSSYDVYPERIKIPKDKRGSGLTFKVNDCYYDDDGEFLYRVPGMK